MCQLNYLKSRTTFTATLAKSQLVPLYEQLIQSPRSHFPYQALLPCARAHWATPCIRPNWRRASYQVQAQLEISPMHKSAKLFKIANLQGTQNQLNLRLLAIQELSPTTPACYYPVPGCNPYVALLASFLSFGIVNKQFYFPAIPVPVYYVSPLKKFFDGIKQYDYVQIQFTHSRILF